MKAATALGIMFLTASALLQPAVAQTNVGSNLSSELSSLLNNLANTNTTTNTSLVQSNFVRRAAADSLLEIELGRVAQTNSQNAMVRQFGQRLVADHTAAYQQAQQLATELGFTLPALDSNPQLLDATQLSQLQRLSSLTGTQFDQEFITSTIPSHIQDISLFEAAAVNAANANVRTFARNQLPVLVQHLVLALQIREMLFNGQPPAIQLVSG